MTNNTTTQMHKMRTQISLETTLLWLTALLKSSVKNVSGDIKYTKATEGGISFNGIKIPPINKRGNLIKFIKTIISDVWSVGLADNKSPIREPRIPINKIPKNVKNKENGADIIAGNKTMKIIAIIEVMMTE